MTRRTAKLVAVYLVLGLAATWAVAWGSSFWGTLGTDPRAYRIAPPSPEKHAHAVEVFRGWGIVLVSRHVVPARTRSTDDSLSAIPWDCRWSEIAQDAYGTGLIDAACGWPVPAMSWHFGGGTLRRGISVSYEKLILKGPGAFERRYQDIPRRVLPFDVYWPGLLADTLFYALLLASLHQLVGWGRRARRRRRGRCAGCNYDLTGIEGPCPECGRPRT